MHDWPHPRSLYRIEYPRRERPDLHIGEDRHEVVDCSEGGVRFVAGPGAWGAGRVVRGNLVLRHGEEVAIEGRVLRVQEGEVAVALHPPGIPFPLVLAEQRYLRGKYPMWPGSREGE